MKTYVFIARRICEIGGAEQYMYNKSRYLESQGWRVLIFSGREGRILISGFARYEKDIYPALRYAPECYSRREVRRTVDRIVERIGSCNGGPCILESDSLNRALWAELIAKRIGAKHLAFVLQEMHGYSADAKAFLRFKYDRHELAGITVSSINQMLGDVERRPDTCISAHCQNVVADCEESVSRELDPAADHTFGSLGRLDKPCVRAILKAFEDYFSSHPDERFNLLLIGGAVREQKEKQILEEFQSFKNVHTVITGNMYPVPSSLLDRVDLFVSTAGSAGVTYRAGRPTVRVHPVTGEPVGIIGLDYDLREKNMYDVIPGLTIRECIDRILQDPGKIVYKYQIDESYFSRMYAEFDRQLGIADLEPGLDYYSEKQLMRIRTTHISRHSLHWLAGHLLGGTMINRLEDIKRGYGEHG